MRLARAWAIVEGVVADASGLVSVFVADAHGELVAAATMDGAAPGVSGLPGEADEQLALAAIERTTSR